MSHRLFERAGSLRSDYEAVDWAATPLGDPSTWPPSLRNVFDIVLSTRAGRTVLAAGLDGRLPWDRSYQELVRLVAATVGAALDRYRVVLLERQRARAARAVSETLQRSMLSVPTPLPGLEVAVRYVIDRPWPRPAR